MNIIDRNALDFWYEGKRPLFDISEAGFCNSRIVKKLLEEIELKTQNYLEYGDSQGTESLLNELSSQYNCAPENILITNGAAEALFLLLLVLCNSSSVVSCQFPYYSTNLDGICKKLGASLHYRNYFDSNFQFSVTAFQNDDLTRKSNVIILNSPNNPTASELLISDYQKIIETVVNGQYVICDEATNISVLPSFLECNTSKYFNKLIAIGGMSKAFGLPGIRIGWIIADKTVISACLAAKESMSVCTSPITQDIATFVLKKRSFVLSVHREAIEKNLKTLEDAIMTNSLPFSIVNSSLNSAFCLVKIQIICSDYQLCSDIFQQSGILLTPGSCFNLPGFIRIGLGVDSNIFTSAIDILCNLFHQS